MDLHWLPNGERLEMLHGKALIAYTTTILEYSIPRYMALGIYHYVENHVSTGSFLKALLSNDLKESFISADGENLKCIQSWVAFLRCEVPSACWGSPEIVKKWLLAEVNDEKGRT